MPTSPSDYQNSGTAAAKAAMHAHCTMRGAHSFLFPDTSGDGDPAILPNRTQWDPKQSGAEQFPIAGNSSAPVKPHYDLESRFGLIIRNRCRSTPVPKELDTALLLLENYKPGAVIGIAELGRD